MFALLTHSHAPFLTGPHVLHTFPYLTPPTPVKCWSGQRFTSCHSDRHHLLHDHRCGKRCINLEMRQVVNHTKLRRQTSVGVCDCVHTSTVTRTNLILGGILMLCAIWLWACLRILYFYLYICTVRVYIVFRNSYLPLFKPTYFNSELLTLATFTPAFFSYVTRWIVLLKHVYYDFYIVARQRRAVLLQVPLHRRQLWLGSGARC